MLLSIFSEQSDLRSLTTITRELFMLLSDLLFPLPVLLSLHGRDRPLLRRRLQISSQSAACQNRMLMLDSSFKGMTNLFINISLMVNLEEYLPPALWTTKLPGKPRSNG